MHELHSVMRNSAGRRGRLEAYVTTLLALVILGIPASRSPAMPYGQVSAEVSGITHLNASQYQVEVTVANTSPGPIHPDDRAFRFSVQSDILGEWIELLWHRETGRADRSVSPLPPGQERKISLIVTLPGRQPHLYRNNEGEVNVRFRYAFTCSNDVRNCAGESSYWLKPGTDRWTLREGM